MNGKADFDKNSLFSLFKNRIAVAKAFRCGYNTTMKIVSTNKKAYHNFSVEETLETGINLIGCEVKSIRASQVNMADSYCKIENGQLYLLNCYVKNYEQGSFSNVNSRRERRLLASSREIARLRAKSIEKSYTIVPLKMYFKGSLVKVEIGLCKGKKLYDKKEAKMQKDQKRAMERDVKEYELRKKR